MESSVKCKRLSHFKVITFTGVIETLSHSVHIKKCNGVFTLPWCRINMDKIQKLMEICISVCEQYEHPHKTLCKSSYFISVFVSSSEKTNTTRMHSSRMRTARLLPVSPSMLCSQGVYLPRRVYLPEGSTCLGVYLPGGGCTCPGGCTCLGGVPLYLPVKKQTP